MDSSSSAELSPSSSRSEGTTLPTTQAEHDIFPDDTAKGDLSSRQDRFQRWRPTFHIQPASGWMNDPCAPGYDPSTGLYHISFQWNPNGVDWGDIAWGTATSPDLIHWTVKGQPILSPDEPYDCKGVFTGCFVNAADRSLAYVYTSVSHLPIHHTIAHVRGCESLSVAKSFDGGKTWAKIAGNPVLPSEPPELDVTGWRDPYVARWPRMSKFLERDAEDTLFGIISGGVRDVTPTTFLYAINAEDISQWECVGAMANPGLNLRPSRWSGDLGRNWEVSNFMTLEDEDDPHVQRDFLVMGTEGCIPDPARRSDSGACGPSRPARGQLWMCGTFRRPEVNSICSQVELSYDYGGHLDHGCLYAANSFFDPVTNRQVVWGWVTEEDLCDELRHAQGWSSMLSMPREMRMQTIHHVVAASSSDLKSITSIEVSENEHGSYSIRTLASQPYQPLVEKLRRHPNVKKSQLGKSSLASTGASVSFSAADMQTTTWELEAVFRVASNARHVGLSIDHSGDCSRSTTLSFDPLAESFTINRPPLPVGNSSDLINSAPECAPHTLFTTHDPATGMEESENLRIRAWRDNSVLEVFVNGRTAITTRLYAAERAFSLRFFADDRTCGPTDHSEIATTTTRTSISELLSATLWDGIGLA